MTETNAAPHDDCSDCWAHTSSSADVAETLKARAKPPTAAGGAPIFHVQTMQGDIINLGALPASALAELLASRRRAR